MADLTLPGRTLLRTAATPAHVDDGVWRTWYGEPTLPLNPHEYRVAIDGRMAVVYCIATGEPVAACPAPLQLVPCPVPF